MVGSILTHLKVTLGVCPVEQIENKRDSTATVIGEWHLYIYTASILAPRLLRCSHLVAVGMSCLVFVVCR
jgi:hypothetical protein